MTTLVTWISVDNRGPSAIYMASDSRITWGSEQQRWDSGQKLFRSRVHPDLYGYSGDVLFPTQFLSQIVELGDSGVLFSDADMPEQRHTKIVQMAKASIKRRHNAPEHDFDIIHAARQDSGKDAEFLIWQLSYCSSLIHGPIGD